MSVAKPSRQAYDLRARSILLFFSVRKMDQSPAYLHAEVTSAINAAAIAVHKDLGPGYLENIYEEALCAELRWQCIAYQRQLPVRIHYRGAEVGIYKLDLVVERKVVVEVKAIEAIHEAHLAVALAYLKATRLKVGLIVNFAGSVMRSRRVFEPAHWIGKANASRREQTDACSLSDPPNTT